MIDVRDNGYISEVFNHDGASGDGGRTLPCFHNKINEKFVRNPVV